MCDENGKCAQAARLAEVKRYTLTPGTDSYWGQPCINSRPDAAGEWVRYDELRSLLGGSTEGKTE